jgi:hypothetical protein
MRSYYSVCFESLVLPVIGYRLEKDMGGLMEFVPARNKLEAVARISQLTRSGPETLGPGSKERKSVVVNLAKALSINIDETYTKQEIASYIAIKLNLPWNKSCESVGQTLTLKGLNTLLQGATILLQEKVKGSGSLVENSLSEEIEKISKVVIEMTPRHMDGVEAITEMKEAEFSQWRGTEWQGFFFEFKVRPELINRLGGGPKKVGSTTFDYALDRTWDMKVHSTSNRHGKKSKSNCALNDAQSIQIAADQGGFGLMILSGKPTYDWDFTRWHKKFRSNSDEEPKKALKKSFDAERIDFFFVPTLSRLEEALKSGEMALFKQGRQPSGEARKIKYSLNFEKSIASDLHIFGVKF